MGNLTTLSERTRNKRIKELMENKKSPLVVLEKEEYKNWDVKTVLNNRNDDRDKLAFMNQIIKEDRKNFWSNLQDSINR